VLGFERIGEVSMRSSAFLALVAVALGGAACGGTTQSSGHTSGTGGASGAGSGMGGDANCPPCVPPPSPDCVGTGPCGCGPYDCPDPCAGGVGCTLSQGGTVDAYLWDDVCSASLLPEVSVLCFVWGP